MQVPWLHAWSPGELDVLVIDEAHMVSDPGRGACLEAALSKLLASGVRPQVIAMTATSAGRGQGLGRR